MNFVCQVRPFKVPVHIQLWHNCFVLDWYNTNYYGYHSVYHLAMGQHILHDAWCQFFLICNDILLMFLCLGLYGTIPERGLLEHELMYLCSHEMSLKTTCVNPNVQALQVQKQWNTMCSMITGQVILVNVLHFKIGYVFTCGVSLYHNAWNSVKFNMYLANYMYVYLTIQNHL